MTITMYGADWCGDCRRAKAYFAENGVPFTYVDLEEYPDVKSVVAERNGGKQNIPVVVFADDSHLTEPSNDELEEKLDALADVTARVTEVRLDDGRARFELRLGGQVLSLATFSEDGGVVTVPHVETDPQFRANGHAATLMNGLLGLLRSSGRTIVPLCPFAADHVRGDRRHHDLVAT